VVTIAMTAAAAAVKARDRGAAANDPITIERRSRRG
jgi:hypothetical protein